MNYNVRIDDNFLKAEHVDGEVLQHTDLNELESVVKTAINANYEDIQKLQLGVETAGSAAGLEANEGIAILSQYQEEPLQATDSKVPSSLQVKSYVDNLFNTPNIGLIYYWDGTQGQEGADVFNIICRKYDEGAKFVFYGRCVMDAGYVDPSTGEWVANDKQVIAPIMVSKRPQALPETEPNIDWYSFTVPPFFLGHGYTTCGIKLTGTWGNFTDVMQVAWSQDMAPIKKSDVENLLGTPLNITLAQNFAYTITNTEFYLSDADARTVFSSVNAVLENRIINLIATINNVNICFLGLLTRSEYVSASDESYYCNIELTSLGQETSYKASLQLRFIETDLTIGTWANDTTYTKITFSNILDGDEVNF